MRYISKGDKSKTIEPQYIEQNKTMSAMLNASEDLVLLLDRRYRIINLNDRVAKRHGGNKKALIGKSILKMLPAKVVKLRKAASEKVFKSNKPYFFTDKNDGHTFQHSIYPVADKNGKVNSIVVYAKDITESKRIQAENDYYRDKLLELQKNLFADTLATLLAHQINQPLTVINMIIPEIIEKVQRLTTDKETVGMLDTFLHQTKAINLIIKSFRRMTHNKAEIKPYKTDIAKVIERAVRDKLLQANGKKLEIQLKIPKNLPKAYGSDLSMEQAFLIIIQNSIDAADGKKAHKLLISAKSGRKNISITLKDDCGGINPEIIDNIFEPFFTTKSFGMGLGLPIVHKILQSCDGTIKAENDYGRGVCFIITIPIKKAVQQ